MSTIATRNPSHHFAFNEVDIPKHIKVGDRIYSPKFDAELIVTFVYPNSVIADFVTPHPEFEHHNTVLNHKNYKKVKQK